MEHAMIDVLSDLAFLAITTGITFLVGRSLLAKGIESLTTFYLLAFAWISFLYRAGSASDWQQAADSLSTRLGVTLMVLGILNALKRLEYAQTHRKESTS
jgi:hypothetical protein